MTIRFVSQMIENDIYTVSSLGTTTSADWITAGSCLAGQDFPNIGRQFKCLSNSITGNGTVQDSQINLLSGTIIVGGDVDANIISSVELTITNTSFEISNIPHVIVDTLPAIAITNTGFDVNNIPHVIVDTLPAIAITNTGFNVDNIPHVIVDTLPAIAITNTGFNVDNIPHVIVDTLPAIAITNTGFNVDNIPHVIVDTLPPIAITNTSFDVSNFPASQPVSGTVDIGNYPASVNVVNTLANSLYIQADTSHPIYAVINTLPSIAITNTGFNSNITNSFITVKNKPTYSVSLEALTTTSQVIRSSAGIIHTVIITSVEQPIISGSIEFVKLYNGSTATQASTPLCTLGIASGQTLTFVADMNFSSGLCVRATNKPVANDTTPTNCIFTMTCFITGYSE